MNEVAILTPSQIKQIVAQAVDIAVSKIQPVHFPSLMTKKQVAKYLDKSTATIDRYMREGMPFTKYGNDHPEFYKSEIDKWVERRGTSQKVQGKENHAEGQELVPRDVVSLEKNRRPDNS